MNNDPSDLSPEHAQEFAQLLEQAALGVEEAQRSIAERYARQVRVVARVLLGPQLRQHFDSMDLLQSVHHSILIGLRQQRFQFSGPEKLIALACAILRRKVAKKWRHMRRQLASRCGSNGNPDSLASLLSSITNHKTDPAMVAQFDDQLAKVCRNMGEIERQMLEMRLDGFTNLEVSERLGLHPVALRVRWSRLRKKLAALGINEELI